MEPPTQRKWKTGQDYIIWRLYVTARAASESEQALFSPDHRHFILRDDDGWTDGEMVVCHWRCPIAVPLWKRMAQMAAQGWPAFRVPNGMPQQVQMDSDSLVVFLPLNRCWINSEKRQRTKEIKRKLWGRRAKRQQLAYNVRNSFRSGRIVSVKK